LSKWEFQAAGIAQCPSCGSANSVRAFPALLVPAAEARPEAALPGEAACFDHPAKRAAAACSQCGRYVCALCSVALGEEIWCPACVSARSGKARAANLETSRTLWDSITLSLPLASLIIWPFTILTAPAALAIGVVKFRAPLSLVRRNRWRLIAGLLISLTEVVFWIWAIVYLITRPLPRGG
jgi:hypothetical protein